MAITISRLSTKVVDDLIAQYPGSFPANTQSILVNAVQSVLTELIGVAIPLSSTEPDYERIMIQLIQALSEDPEWYDQIVAGTGHALTRMIASSTALNEFSIARAFQEAFMRTASADNSIFAGTRMLGVRPKRKRPSRVNVTFSRDVVGDYYEIPALNTFKIGDLFFFNRDKIVYKATQEEAAATLYQGLVVTETIVSNGEPFQWFYLGSGKRTASDTDVHVLIDGIEWTRITEGPWQMNKNGQQYYESTAANGDIEIRFGNGDFGAVPPTGKEIKVIWIETLGLNGNLDSTADAVTMVSLETSLITGITTSTAQSGDDEVSAKVYKNIAPNLRAANRRGVRRSDYRALALEYPGVRDALFRGQAEVAPGRRSMMNVVCVTLLTTSTFDFTQWAEFEKDFTENLGVYKLQMLRIDPVPQIVNIDASIFCRPEVSLQRVKSELTRILEEKFAPKDGHLGYNMYLSDISDILNGRDRNAPKEWLERGVEYCTIAVPTTDTILAKKTMYCKLGSLNLDVQYTTRGGFQGRLDLSPSTSVPA